jgi:hypothetical protein
MLTARGTVTSPLEEEELEEMLDDLCKLGLVRRVADDDGAWLYFPVGEGES